MSTWADGKNKKLWNIIESQKKHIGKYKTIKSWLYFLPLVKTPIKHICPHPNLESATMTWSGTLCFKEKMSYWFLFLIWFPKQVGLLKVGASYLACDWAVLRSLQLNRVCFSFNLSTSKQKSKIVTNTSCRKGIF